MLKEAKAILNKKDKKLSKSTKTYKPPRRYIQRESKAKLKQRRDIYITATNKPQCLEDTSTANATKACHKNMAIPSTHDLRPPPSANNKIHPSISPQCLGSLLGLGRRISERYATNRLAAVHLRMAKIVSGHLPKDEAEYFARHLLYSNFRTPQFYGSPKVHKDKLPVPLRPFVSQCGSLLAVASIYIDYKLQPLMATIPNYIKNSEHVRK